MHRIIFWNNPLKIIYVVIRRIIIFMIIAFSTVTLPVIGIPPVVFLLEYVGIISHWSAQRFFDCCTANWMTIMTVSGV